MPTENLVYFFHAKGDDYCKIGRSTSQRMSDRLRAFKAAKDSVVTVMGYQFCKDKKAAKALEHFLLNQFDRIADQELVAITPELVRYIQDNCDHKDTRYLTSLWTQPDYDDFAQEAFDAEVEQHDSAVTCANEALQLAFEKQSRAKRSWEAALSARNAAVLNRSRYLEAQVIALREKDWEIDKISEVTGLDTTEVRNLVYNHAPPQLFSGV